MFMEIYDRFNEADFARHYNQLVYQWEWKDYDDFMEKYGPETNPEAHISWRSMSNFFQGIGLLLKRKLIDISLVGELMPFTTFAFWEKMGPVWKARSERLKRPKLGELNEYLYNEIKKYEEQLAKASK